MDNPRPSRLHVYWLPDKTDDNLEDREKIKSQGYHCVKFWQSKSGYTFTTAMKGGVFYIFNHGEDEELVDIINHIAYKRRFAVSLEGYSEMILSQVVRNCHQIKNGILTSKPSPLLEMFRKSLESSVR